MSAERTFPRTYSPAPALKIKDWIRVSRSNACPVCRRSDWCEVSNDGLVVHCMRTPSQFPSTARLGGWLHFLKAKVSWAIGKTIAPHFKGERLPEDILDKMNRRIIDLLPDVIPAHLPLITPIDPANCRSFNRAISERVATQVALEYGTDLADRHPALVHKGQDEEGRPRYDLAAYNNGVIIPVTNERTNQVLGFQLKTEQRFKNGRYKWVSSEGKGGTPFGLKYTAAKTRVFLIEGRRKAEAGFKHFGDSFVYFAGVTTYDRQELFKELEALEATEVVIAFDQDKHTNQIVHRAELNLVKLIQKERPGLAVQTLEWPREAGKGLDDALAAGFTEFEFKVVAQPKRKKVVTGLPLSELTKAFGNQVRELLDINQSHKAHADFACEHLLSETCRQVVIDSPTGAGKSRAYDDAVAALVMTGQLDKRVLIVCADKANVAERTAPGTELARLIQSDQARIQLGRQPFNPDRPATDYDCHNINQARAAGISRHVPAKSVCQTCPFSSPEKWAETYGNTPMSWNCQEKGYLHSRKLSKKAQVVIATKEAYLNGSEELDSFDFLVVDEALLPLLVERVAITKETLAGWRNRYGIYERARIKELKRKGGDNRAELRRLIQERTDWFQLFDILDHVMAGIAGTHAGDLNPAALHPVMAAIKEAAGKLGVLMFDAWFSGLTNPTVSQDGEEIYPFEKPFSDSSNDGGPSELRFPLRAGYDLLRALSVGDHAIKAQRAQDGTFGLVITQVQGSLVERLAGKSMAILDATPPPLLFKLLPQLEVKTFDVAQQLVITQTTNALFTKHDLNKAQARESCESAISKFFEGADRPLVILPKRYEEGEKAIKVPAGAQVGHWGKDDRATNRFSDCDRLVLLGHQERPIDYIQAEVEAVRAYRGEVDPTPVPGDKLRLYNTVIEPGRTAAGRWCNSHPDPDVQAAIEHDYTAFIKQAIGRLRATLRSPDQPAEVLILCAEPVGNLSIDHLTTVQDLLKSEQRTGPSKLPLSAQQVSTKVECTPDAFPLYILGKTKQVPVLLFDRDVENDEGRVFPYYDPWNEELPPDFFDDIQRLE